VSVRFWNSYVSELDRRAGDCGHFSRPTEDGSGGLHFDGPEDNNLSEIKASTRTPGVAWSILRLFGYGAMAIAFLATLAVNLYTLFQINRARTSVPWADQWAVVQELEQHARGAALWPILWSPYWGHRLVIPRLLFLADSHWFSFASLTWLTLLLQLVHIGFLIALAWMLLGRRSTALFIIAVIVILNLMLSPFQMENFVWGMQTMFPLVFVAATGAFLSLSLGSTNHSGYLLSLCVAFGIVSSYTMPNGILVWPVLVLQSIYLRQKRKGVLALGGIGTLVIVSYLWRYARPLELGMGMGGILRHPIDTIMLLALILGSPFRFTIAADVAVGMLALATTGYVLIRALFSRAQERRWSSTLFALILFLFLSSLTLIAGRLTPEFLHLDSKDPLPSRYFTMICLFWVSIGLLALSTVQGRRLRALLLGFYGLLFASLMFASVNRQLTDAEDWADFFLATDAVGSAFVLDVPDEQLLSVLWTSRPQREELILFMRQHALAMFHEPRATWPGKRVSALFQTSPDRCVGAIEKTVGVDGSSWRMEGWAWDNNASRAPDEVLFADANGRVVGLARGGLRHGYFPGFLIDSNSSPPWHTRFRDSEWLGYVRQGGDSDPTQLSLYGLFRNEGKVCAIINGG